MGGKHKKTLRSEKAKVKLKGAKLPKGLNITKTEFKVKKIVIRDQLIEGSIEDGKRKHSIKEVLSRLKNHNNTVRLEALKTLKEFIDCSLEETVQHLGSIIQSISEICLSLESDARRESFKVLNVLFGVIPADIIEPFFHIVSSYLRCAMTHIQPVIQEDSLLFLDVILKHLPRMVISNSENIFANFIDMISNLRTDSKPGRMLNVKLGNTTTTMQWRSKVLLRLRDMLKTLVEYRQPTSFQCSPKNTLHLYSRFVLNMPQYFSPIRNSLNKNCNMSSLFKKNVGVMKKTDDVHNTKSYIDNLLPLLIESWLEVAPPSVEKSSHRIVLSTETAFTLKLVLEIIYLLWALAEITDKLMCTSDLEHWFRTQYANQFVTHFLKLFPYEQSPDIAGSNKKKMKPREMDVVNSGDQYCIIQNLSVAFIYFTFYNNLHQEQELSAKVLDFVHRIMSKPQLITLENFSIVEKSLRIILYKNGIFLLSVNNFKTRAILRSVILNFQDGAFPRECKSKIVALLCDIILSSNLHEAYGSEEFSDWLPTLPLLLLKPTILHHTLLTLSKLGKQQNGLFLNSLAKHVVPVIDNIAAIQAVGSKNQFEGKKLIMNLFFWIDSFSSEERIMFLETIDNAAMKDHRISSYFKDILGSR